MMRTRGLVMVVVVALGGAIWANDDPLTSAGSPPIDHEALNRFIRAWDPHPRGHDGQWAFQVGETEMMVLSDERHDRMRIMTPVADSGDLNRDQLHRILEANFDRALDARYAIWRGQVWSAYLHPLKSLSEEEFHRAVEQVVRLRKNYGTTYASSDVQFGQ